MELCVKESKFSEEQIARILKEVEAGAKVAETTRAAAWRAWAMSVPRMGHRWAMGGSQDWCRSGPVRYVILRINDQVGSRRSVRWVRC